NFIVPTLGNQAPLIQKLQLNGQIDQATLASTITSNASAGERASANQSTAARSDRVYGPAQILQTNQPEFSGTAAPGSVVRLSIGPVTKPWDTMPAGVTTANENGQWSLTTHRPLRHGQY